MVARLGAKPDPRWALPGGIFVGAWIVQALSYSASGVGKLWSPSWIDGSALSLILEGPLVRPTGLADLLAALPPIVLQALTWTFLALEVMVAPLSLTAWGRPCAWGAMVKSESRRMVGDLSGWGSGSPAG